MNDRAGEGASSEGGNNRTIVTKEMFMRELLKDPSPEDDPVVKRAGKNGKKKKQHKGYKILDNRDSLPFAVKLATPDPYTHPDLKRKRASKAKPRRRPGAVEESLISSKLYSSSSPDDGNSDDHLQTLLGEYELDKHTTTGDLLEIADRKYKVIKHRCLYKYAGGKKFVMVKKILHVKEIGRLQAEEYLLRQLKSSSSGGEQ